MKTRILKALDHRVKTQPRRESLDAVLGDGQNHLKVDGRNGFVYALVKQPSGTETLMQVRCRKVTQQYALPVKVRPNAYDDVWEVVEDDPVSAIEFWGDTGMSGNVAQHASSHTLLGGDPALIDARQLLTFRVYPTSPPSTSVQVAPYLYRYGGTWKFYAGTSAYDLISYIPSSLFNLQKVVCLGIAGSSNTLAVVAGAESYVAASDITAIAFTGADVATALASAAEDFIAGKAIRLYGAQTAINMYDAFYDCMQLAGSAEHRLHKWNATTVPTASDDSTLGYSVGSLIGIPDTEQLFACLDATTAAAVWVELTGASTSSDWWDVDLAPDSPSALDDEFNDSSVDVKWSTWNSTAWSEGAAYLSKAVTPATAVLGLSQTPIPAGDFTVFCKMRLSTTGYVSGTTTALGGLALFEGTTAQKVAYFGYYKEPAIATGACWHSHWSDATTYVSSASYGATGVAVGTFLYLRLRRTGTTYYADWSTDGKTWHENTLTLGFTPTLIGVAIANTGTSASNTFEFDFFRYRNTFDTVTTYGYGKATLAAHALGVHTDMTGAVQGDLIYASAAATFSLLNKDATATRYLANTGADNNPAWDQVELTNGVSGALPIANGGTNATSAADARTNLGLVAGGAGDIWVEKNGDTMTGVLKTAGRQFATVTKTSGYTLTATDEVIICNSATPFTLTLPAATGTGETYWLKNINSGAITVDGDSSDTIDGQTTQTLAQWDAMIIHSYAANAWVIF